MPKNNNQNQTNNSETTPVTPEEIIAEVQATPVETGAEIVQFAGRKGGTNGFAAFNAKRTEAVQNKVQTIQEARKLLAEAATAVNAGDAEAEKANEPAAKGGLLLFKAMAAGILSNDEASDILGSTFGWKQKQNGEQSKTPLGMGEVIRKRVVRAYKAYDYAIAGNEPVAFFEPLEREDVQPLVNAVLDGNLGLWEFYNQSGELKADKTGKRPKAVFDPRRIAALTRDLGENIQRSVEIIQQTPGLFSAYAGLLQMIETIGAEMPVPEVTEAA